MSYEEDKRDKIITKKVNDFRLWKHSHNLKNENIIMKANRNQSKIKQYSNELNEEENTKNQKKTKNSQKVSKNSVQFDSSTSIKYINDNYRRQLNKAFLNFNPIIHLGNLNILRKADPEINSDIEKLTKHIDEDLVEIKTIIIINTRK